MRIAISRVSPQHVDDVMQTVRERLLVGRDSRGPRICDYAGEGALQVWLRVIAIREAIDLARKAQRVVPEDDVLWQQVSPEIQPAMRLVRAQAVSFIKVAFHTALSDLTVRQRLLLRQHLIDGLTIDELGSMYQVHRATAARWLSAAREELWTRVKSAMKRDLKLTETELTSLVRQVRSSIDLSIERALS